MKVVIDSDLMVGLISPDISIVDKIEYDHLYKSGELVEFVENHKRKFDNLTKRIENFYQRNFQRECIRADDMKIRKYQDWVRNEQGRARIMHQIVGAENLD